MISQRVRRRIAAAIIGHMWSIQRRSPGQKRWRIAARSAAANKIARSSDQARVSEAGWFFEAQRWMAKAIRVAMGIARSVRRGAVGTPRSTSLVARGTLASAAEVSSDSFTVCAWAFIRDAGYRARKRHPSDCSLHIGEEPKLAGLR